MGRNKIAGLVVGGLLAAASAGSPAAVISVNTTVDELNSDGDCSLREAVRSANTDTGVDNCSSGSGADTIQLPIGTYELTVTGTENDDATANDLDLTQAVTLESSGQDPSEVVIRAGTGFPDQALDYQVGGSAQIRLHWLTFADFQDGVFLSNNSGSDLVVDGCVFRDNRSSNPGGAINNQATTYISSSTFLRNSTEYSPGGAVNSNILHADNSTFVGNAAGTNGSLFGNGGAIAIRGTTTTNSTLNNVTITSNSAAGDGGGLYVGSGNDLAMRNSILAGNRTDGTGPECKFDGGIIGTSTDHNLVQDDSGCITPNSPITGQEPGLALAGRYDGPAAVRPPLTSSPVIDAGSCTDTGGNDISTDYDQRGSPAVRNVDGDGDSTAGCDIGAVERQNVALTVTGTGDTGDASAGDGTCDDGSGTCTLRAAIDEANNVSGLDEVVLPAGTFAVTQGTAGENANADGDFDVRGSLILHGAGAGETILDGGNLDRVLDLPDIGGSPRTLHLSGLTVRNGDTGAPSGASTSEPGGGIRVAGNTNEANQLRAAEVRVTGNHARGISSDGGGISVAFGDAQLVRSTIDANEADRSGSGIHSSGGADTRLLFTTVTGNSADNRGAVTSLGGAEVYLAQSTVVDNQALQGAQLGGSSGIEVRGSIVASSAADDCDFFSGPGVTSLGYNLEDGTDCGFTATGDLQSTAPDLAALADVGGPVPLREPDAGSGAAEAGACADGDNRILERAPFGGTRPQDADATGSGTGDGSYDCDIGAAERQQVRGGTAPNPPSARTVDTGSTGVVMAQFRFANESNEALSGNSLTLRAAGSGDDAADVTAVKLYVDANSDGQVDVGDAQVATAKTFGADDGTATFSLAALSSVPSTGTADFLVTYDFGSQLAAAELTPAGTRPALAGAAPLGLLALTGLLGLGLTRRGRWPAAVALALLLTACGGGGGGGGGGGSTAQTETFAVALEDMTVTGDTSGRDLDLRVPPATGATVTVTE